MNTCEICKCWGFTPDTLKQKLWCETQKSTYTVYIFTSIILFTRFSMIAPYYLFAVCLNVVLFQGLIQRVSLPWSHSWFFKIIFQFYFHYICATSQHLKWLSLHYCYLCAYLIYPINLKTQKEWKISLLIIVTPNIGVNEWISRYPEFKRN